VFIYLVSNFSLIFQRYGQFTSNTLHYKFYCNAFRGNWKQWKQKPEMENGNGQNLMQINVRVKPLINYYLLKTTSVQYHFCVKTT